MFYMPTPSSPWVCVFAVAFWIFTIEMEKRDKRKRRLEELEEMMRRASESSN